MRPAGIISGPLRSLLARRPLALALVLVLLSNGAFFLLTVFSTPDPNVVLSRIRTAFQEGELGLTDYRQLDSRRGWHQYNDCNVLQMLSNPDASRLRRGIAPLIYKADEDFNEACPVLYAIVIQQAERDTLLSFRYARYWHGYNLVPAFALRVMELSDLRFALKILVWTAIALLMAASFWSGPRLALTSRIVACCAATLWAVPYFAPSLTHGPGDAFILLMLALLAFRPPLAHAPDSLLPFAAAYGAGVVFFEMLTGQLPIAAAWLVVFTLAAARDVKDTRAFHPPVLAVAALLAFGLGAAGTVLVKQLLAYFLVEPAAGADFLTQLRQYTAFPRVDGPVPAALQPFLRLARASRTLAYGSQLGGLALVALIVVGWLTVVVRGWKRRSIEQGRDILAIAGAAVIPLGWVLMLPNHTFIHATFMVRILVVPLSLVPIALLWLAAGARRDRSVGVG